MKLTKVQKQILELLQNYSYDHGTDDFNVDNIITEIYPEGEKDDEDVLEDCFKLEGYGLIENSSPCNHFRITKKGILHLDPDSYDKTMMKLTKKNIKFTKVAIVLGVIVLSVTIISLFT